MAILFWRNKLTRNLSKTDIPFIMDLLDRCKPYVLAHHEYIYWMLSNYHSKSCFVFAEGEQIIGFLGTLQSIEKSTAFIWQICVDPDYRRKNIAFKLLKELEKLLRDKTIQNIQLSIADGNSASFNLFDSFSKQNDLTFRKIDSIEISGNVDSVYIIEE
jgi:L-2,4-diaminobutyric acid acetyltransferase